MVGSISSPRHMNGVSVHRQLRMGQRAEGAALALASQTNGNQRKEAEKQEMNEIKDEIAARDGHTCL
jgi:hypothetical protein